ncbi:MAG TPA: hypothetical protein VGK73_07835 [Polyangiaceae bacterium]
MSEPAGPAFSPSFRRRARAVRGRLWLRSVLFGAAFGAALGGVLVALLWWQRLGALRAGAFAASVLGGVVVAALLSRRRRWSDADVALYLDARLGTNEVIATAVEGGEADARAAVREAAARALAESNAKRLRPRLLHRWHALLPVGSAAAVWLSVVPLPPPPPLPPLPPGAEKIRLSDLAGLERIEALAELGGSNPAQEARLKRLAEEAKKLRAELKAGLEKREALARIAKLRDDIASEKLRFGDAGNRAGLDAAIAELDKQKLTGKAARALSDGDLTAFDEEMQKLAALAEKEDREAAKLALEEAAKAAREKGAKALAEALEREKKAMERAEANLDALRELAKQLEGALDSEGKGALGELNRSGSPEAQRKLSEALDRALKKLTEEERKRLAENLRRGLEQGGGGGGRELSREELKELAKRLEQKGSEAELEEQLRELARRDPSEDARREQGLGDADRGGADAQKKLGVPLPLGGPGSGAGKKDTGPKQELADSGGNKNKGGGAGNQRDEGKGNHDGSTPPVDAKELRSKAGGTLLPGAPMHAASQGRAPARAGETANQLGTGTLGKIGPAEVGAVEGADIPEEYREQVGRYFEP